MRSAYEGSLNGDKAAVGWQCRSVNGIGIGGSIARQLALKRPATCRAPRERHSN